MIKFLKKHKSNIIFIIVIVFIMMPTTKEWLIKTMSFSPSVNTEEIVLKDYQWSLKAINGELLNFSELKGKVVFVNFWATWCAPCRAEMPAIQALYTKYKDDVAFVFISQESKAEVLPFMEKYNYNLPIYSAATRIPNKLNTSNSIPNTYVISKKGKIVIHKTGAANWDSKATYKIMDTLIAE